ncbi:NAD(P)/FAD-dependent oxidoreductase [Chitinophaga pendula]|uniref:phytoene desaturase family protein n=1 Tax=Chitinophaga TaxID=79328 RepID=UPI000BAEEAF7|nr:MULTISPECIES: NAD(P)/FAD-dependent oxidoreductase [Chitinophaga]ASZ12312.1 FAD-dependent oxidoreductase [Chitinophaga sp. MD30]UCJ10096.1 NAD(P)/FAD-dependent oxidoreductase [Chitinophaga pendula]
MATREYDAVIVGSGPNGLAAGITLQRAGLSVLLIEGKDTLGGGMRSAALTLPGFIHDVCSAVHPMAMASPFFQGLPPEGYGVNFLHPRVLAAHPFDDGRVALLYRDLAATAAGLGEDGASYERLFRPLIARWPGIAADVLGPLRLPRQPFDMAGFGMKALQSGISLSRHFRTREAQGLWAGMVAHSMQPLSKLTTAAIGLVLTVAGHLYGWPIPRGGTQQMADGLAAYFRSLGGIIETGRFVRSLRELPVADALLFDVTPRQLLEIAGPAFSALYRWQLRRYRYGMGVFKIDWALDGAVPFRAAGCLEAGTVHLGNTIAEVAQNEQAVWNGKHPEQPFVLLSQPSVIDPSRAPAGKQSVWAYCHVPNGSTRDMTAAIERQVERFAPGFRDRILARHTMHTGEMELYNPNYIGGDINGGTIDIRQLFARPALRWSPYRTSAKGIYICSCSTPPGGGVHGLSGYHAARRVLQDIFKHRL